MLLDLDGTLVSSFTPRRAPVLPASMKTHLVGVGSSLNPAGVFVVERPGLGQFLQQLAALAEVVVFTAGVCGGCVAGVWGLFREQASGLCLAVAAWWVSKPGSCSVVMWSGGEHLDLYTSA